MFTSSGVIKWFFCPKSGVGQVKIDTLDMGKNKLEEVELELRDFSSMTIAGNPEKLAEAKTIIREFRQKLASLLRDGEKTEVYQIAIQLYPLIKTSKEN